MFVTNQQEREILDELRRKRDREYILKNTARLRREYFERKRYD